MFSKDDNDRDAQKELIDEYLGDCGFYTCPLCNKINSAIIENKDCCVILDGYPVTEHHALIIPKYHKDFNELTLYEKIQIDELMNDYKYMMECYDSTIEGGNIGGNVGRSAGQTIFHAHLHMIPRRTGDIEDPTGGIRGCIPEKRVYK